MEESFIFMLYDLYVDFGFAGLCKTKTARARLE
jgi:hypothetical protein